MPLLQLRQFSQIRLLWGWVILVSCKVVVGRFPWQILLRDKEHLLDMPSSRTNLCIVVQFLKIFSLFFTVVWKVILIFCPFEVRWFPLIFGISYEKVLLSCLHFRSPHDLEILKLSSSSCQHPSKTKKSNLDHCAVMISKWNHCCICLSIYYVTFSQ